MLLQQAAEAVQPVIDPGAAQGEPEGRRVTADHRFAALGLQPFDHIQCRKIGAGQQDRLRFRPVDPPGEGVHFLGPDSCNIAVLLRPAGAVAEAFLVNDLNAVIGEEAHLVRVKPGIVGRAQCDPGCAERAQGFDSACAVVTAGRPVRSLMKVGKAPTGLTMEPAVQP